MATTANNRLEFAIEWHRQNGGSTGLSSPTRNALLVNDGLGYLIMLAMARFAVEHKTRGEVLPFRHTGKATTLVDF